MIQFSFIRTQETGSDSTRTVRITLGESRSLTLDQDVDGFDGEIRKTAFTVADIQDTGFLLATTFKRAQTLALQIDDSVKALYEPAVWVKWLSLGLALSAYDYQHKASHLLEPAINGFELASGDPALCDAFCEGQVLAESQLIARELVNKPGNIIYPASFVSAVEALGMDGVTLTYLTEAEMDELGFGRLGRDFPGQ